MPGRMLGHLLLIFIAVSMPVMAGAAVSGRQADSTGQETLQRGIELYRAGQPEEALSRLRGFVLRHGNSPLLPEAYLYLARIFHDSGHPAEALLYLDRIPTEKRRPEARLLEGAARIGAGEADRGIELLLPLENAELSDADRRLRLTSLAQGHVLSGQSLPALFFLHRALTIPGSGSGEKLLQEAHVLLRDRLSDTELAEASFMFGGTAVGEDARLQMALRAFSRGQMGRAQQMVEAVVQSGISFPYRRDAVLLKDRLSGQSWYERTIGVILPLSGRYAVFGELVRRGMELALQVHSDSAVRLLFIDTDADPEKTAQAVSSLVKEQRVMAIAGPLTGAAANAAAVRAQEERVPLLTLSQRDGLAETGEYVFRDSLTNRLQIRTLVTYAMEERGLTEFGVLFPENRQGKEMAELFTMEVGARGGRVVIQQSYLENETDFRVQVRRLQGRDPHADHREEPGQAKPEEEPALFQALFLPDYADRVGLILPQLDYYGLQKTQLLGINGWNSPELLRLAGRSVEGAVFVDGFFRDSHQPLVQEFVNLYLEKFGEEPSILEAQGFDAAGILLTLLAEPGTQTREDLRLGFSQMNPYPGVTGATTFNLQGDAEKVLFILEVQNGEIVQIN